MIETVLFQSDILNLNAALEAACSDAAPVTHSANAATDLRSLANALGRVADPAPVSVELEAESLVRVRQ